MRESERRVPFIRLKSSKLASANLIAFIVAACGGGGGGGSSGSTPIPSSNNAPMAGSDTSISLTEDVTAGALTFQQPILQNSMAVQAPTLYLLEKVHQQLELNSL